MSSFRVEGGTITKGALRPHVCSPPEPRKYDCGDVFKCDACGARHVLKDAQSYQGGAYWSRLPEQAGDGGR